MAELSAGGPIRVVLADDHPIWRDGVRADLADGFEVVGEAASASEAIAVIRATRPDLVVCDLHMPGGGGIAVARACGELAPVVMLTVSEAERDLLDAIAAGAIGYLVKSTPGPQLRAALLRAAAGEPVFSPALAALVLGEFRRIAKAIIGSSRCPNVNVRSCSWSPGATPTGRSGPSCISRRRPSRTMFATSWPSSTCPGRTS